MTDDAPCWLVRLTYRAPAPEDRNGRLIDLVKQQRCIAHDVAHDVARRWANTPLPTGAVDPTIQIEHRAGDGRLLRIEDWTIPAQPTPTRRQAVEEARRRLAG